MSPYEGITYPHLFYNNRLIRWFWKKYMCPQNKHVLDEVHSDVDWYLSCDICNIEIHINKINKEYCE